MGITISSFFSMTARKRKNDEELGIDPASPLGSGRSFSALRGATMLPDGTTELTV